MNNATANRLPASVPGVDTRDCSLRSRTYELLRTAILDGRYTAGQKLVERELCELTGASRSILREALAKLESSGLIASESYRGYSVSKLKVKNVYEIFELRICLETLAAELFTERASDQEISKLVQTLDELEECLVHFDLGRMRLAKERYYEILFTGCRNIEILRALENVIDRIYYLRSGLMLDPERRKASLAEMRRLTAAVVERDRLSARTASIAHLEAARDAVLNQIQEVNQDQSAQSTNRRKKPAGK